MASELDGAATRSVYRRPKFAVRFSRTGAAARRTLNVMTIETPDADDVLRSAE
jgi:hypothetical protein